MILIWTRIWDLDRDQLLGFQISSLFRRCATLRQVTLSGFCLLLCFTYNRKLILPFWLDNSVTNNSKILTTSNFTESPALFSCQTVVCFCSVESDKSPPFWRVKRHLVATTSAAICKILTFSAEKGLKSPLLECSVIKKSATTMLQVSQM